MEEKNREVLYEEPPSKQMADSKDNRCFLGDDSPATCILYCALLRPKDCGILALSRFVNAHNGDRGINNLARMGHT